MSHSLLVCWLVLLPSSANLLLVWRVVIVGVGGKVAMYVIQHEGKLVNENEEENGGHSDSLSSL